MKRLLLALTAFAMCAVVSAQEAPAAAEKAPDAADKAGDAWKAAIKAIDQNGDGKCTPAECNDFVEKTEAELTTLRQQNMLARIMRLDQNQDGAVAKDELPEDNDQVSMLFNRLDTNQDGKIDQDEMKTFFATAGNRQRMGAERRPRAQNNERRGQRPEAQERRGDRPGNGMARFDKNQDGVVTRDEMPADRPALTTMFDRLDANKDGKIDQEEMKAARPAAGRGAGRGEGRRNQPAPAGIEAE